MVGAALTGAAVLVKRLASRSGGFDFERLIERMPENAPPNWIFRNISAIRENTERILQVLESERTSAGPGPSKALLPERSSQRQGTQPDLHPVSEPRWIHPAWLPTPPTPFRQQDRNYKGLATTSVRIGERLAFVADTSVRASAP